MQLLLELLKHDEKRAELSDIGQRLVKITENDEQLSLEVLSTRCALFGQLREVTLQTGISKQDIELCSRP